MEKCKYLETHEIESQIKCPYCGHLWTDSWEVLESEGDTETMECDCGKNFIAEMCMTVDYRTSKDCELNNEQHEYESVRNGWKVCKKCGTHQEI
jgi:hypothetical protein